MTVKVNRIENEKRKIIASLNNFRVLEYLKDPSVTYENAEQQYFMGQMGVRRRQLVIDLDKEHSAVLQAGAMQWMAGDVKAATGIKGVGDLLGKMVRSSVTKETAVKPEYEGTGIVVLEPTYKFIVLQNPSEWGPEGMVIEDGMFLACDSRICQSITARSNLSSAALGHEGLFNLTLKGNGTAALECNVPFDEMVEVELENDVLKIDGDYAVCWSASLEFTVERSSKSIAGSLVNNEGLVNVYRGTGKILMSTVER